MNPGDTVRYAGRFLRDIGALDRPEIHERRGTVREVRDDGPAPTRVTVAWDDGTTGTALAQHLEEVQR